MSIALAMGGYYVEAMKKSQTIVDSKRESSLGDAYDWLLLQIVHPDTSHRGVRRSYRQAFLNFTASYYSDSATIRDRVVTTLRTLLSVLSAQQDTLQSRRRSSLSQPHLGSIFSGLTNRSAEMNIKSDSKTSTRDKRSKAVKESTGVLDDIVSAGRTFYRERVELILIMAQFLTLVRQAGLRQTATMQIVNLWDDIDGAVRRTAIEAIQFLGDNGVEEVIQMLSTSMEGKKQSILMQQVTQHLQDPHYPEKLSLNKLLQWCFVRSAEIQANKDTSIRSFDTIHSRTMKSIPES